MTWVRTFADDLYARSGDGKVDIETHCLGELVRAVRYTWFKVEQDYANDRDVTRIDIQRLRLGRGGYLQGGQYRGAGLPIFELDITVTHPSGDFRTIFHEVRAADRRELRRTLKKMFRNATIGR